MSPEIPPAPTLVTDGIRVNVPLFHGTSIIFIPEIRSGGLGATNPHLRLNTLEFLREIIAYLQNHSLSEAENRLLEPILNQCITAANFNFRHGASYLTPSRDTAVRYALRNRYGSELLSIAFYLFDKLKTIDCESALDIASRYSELHALSERKHEPVLIKVKDIPVGQLRSEVGGDPSLVLTQMQETANAFEERLLPVLWQQENFELREPIAPEQLECFRIIWLNNDTDLPSYELERL